MLISIIVAVSSNNVIGAGGGMPWTLPSDLKNFRRLTMGKPIIMGRKTYESIGRPLHGRTNIVVTRNPDFSPVGIVVCANLKDALDQGHAIANKDGVDEICIIGGGEIYRAALDRVNQVYLTRVHRVVEGDTVFPILDPEAWLETGGEPRKKEAGDSVETSFHVFERRSI